MYIINNLSAIHEDVYQINFFEHLLKQNITNNIFFLYRISNRLNHNCTALLPDN